jgi:hypothetical protein
MLRAGKVLRTGKVLRAGKVQEDWKGSGGLEVSMA